jgi:hypothetical protein
MNQNDNLELAKEAAAGVFLAAVMIAMALVVFTF